MSKVKISRKEIEKKLKDQLDCKNINWKDNGDCMVEIDFEQLKKEKEKTIIRDPYIVPIYREPYRPYGPYWIWNKTTSTISYTTSNTGGK